MSIQLLPEDVIAQIKSSAAITSLNGAICGLLQNSLDAGASTINISVDYSRANCSVEDNGCGITPASFREDGGLGKLHYTSKYPPSPDRHGKRGEFLASLGALSLLSIASHHCEYRTHNSLTIHNSRVVARHTPALPEQRVLAFASGTRVIVRDLFGSMPVRVKQRAMEVERFGTSKDFEQLVYQVVSLLLAWPGEATVSAQDTYSHRTVTLHASKVPGDDSSHLSTAHTIAPRTATLLTQASLVEQIDMKSWVPIGASAPGVSVQGCVSLRPVATKRVQFIALGVQPLPNERNSNLLYEEFNRVFVESDFGVVEEVALGDDGLPAKTDSFTGKELKPRRGIDRWPMFFLQINLGDQADPVNIDEYLDEGRNNLLIVTDLLQVVAYEFLKKHHFRPKSINALERLRRPRLTPAIPPSQSILASSLPPRDQIQSATRRPRSKRESRKGASSSHLSRSSSMTRPISPFSSWARVKSGTKSEAAVTATRAADKTQAAGGFTLDTPDACPKTEIPLFDRSGNLMRKPFDDVDDTPACQSENLTSGQAEHASSATDTHSPRETVVWVDPMTKVKSVIDKRTGFAVKTSSGRAKVPSRLTEVVEDPSRPLKGKPAPSGHRNTVFQPKELAIPQVLQIPEALGCGHNVGVLDVKDIANGSCSANPSPMREGRISKAGLQRAEILGQVDQKFILIKASTEFPAGLSNSVNRADQMLIMIDQHAADERCRVEELLKRFFVPDPTSSGKLAAQTQYLDKPLRFDVSAQEAGFLSRLKSHFAYWGIVYEVLQDPLEKGVSSKTAEVRALPPSIAERCRLEPKLLIDLLRKEIWKQDWAREPKGALDTAAQHDWIARFHGCPEGIMDLISSRACRSAIMFNDPLTLDQCSELVGRLALCAFPFQCAHGRPSMVPLVSLGCDSTLAGVGAVFKEEKAEDLITSLKRWKCSIERRR